MSMESRLAAEQLIASIPLPYTEAFRESLVSRITDALDASWLQGLEDGKTEGRFHMVRESLQKDLDSYNAGRVE